MRLAPAPDPKALHEFLRDTGYPFEWPEDVLARYCAKTAIETSSGDVAGYVWFTWVSDADKVLDFHIAVHPKYRSRVFTRRVLHSLLSAIRSTGARTVMARPTSEEHAQQLRRLGFSIHGPFAVFPLSKDPPEWVR